MRHLGTAASIAALLVLSACNSSDVSVEDGAGTETKEAAPAAPATGEVAAPAIEPLAAAGPVETAEQIDGIENRRVSFGAGADSATIEDVIIGYEIVDYLLNVQQGQALNISMATQNTATYFNILEPGNLHKVIDGEETGTIVN